MSEHQHKWQSVFMYKFCDCGASELTEAGKEIKEQKQREFYELFAETPKTIVTDGLSKENGS